MASKWILRKGTKERGFRYAPPAGAGPVSAEVRERIRSLGIPPAWKDVHVAWDSRAAIQAWGLDARGRKQYRYHPRAVEKGELRKFYRVRQMARDLPAMRRKVALDSRRRGFTREKVAAVVVRLIAHGFFRVGSERYVRENNTFGMTTMRKSHVGVYGDNVVFDYHGKGSIRHRQIVVDAELARLIRALLETPGSSLFRYRTRDGWHNLDAREVNEYFRSLTGFPYTVKDLRTWGGTLRAATILADLGPGETRAEAKRNVVTTLRLVASELGNTPAICRKAYVHPAVINQYTRSGSTIEWKKPRSGRPDPLSHAPEEKALIEFLDRHFPERRKKPRSKE
ncbi:MAG: DNA topoisomerase IB [Gemmatimonadaceae bacterium]